MTARPSCGLVCLAALAACSAGTNSVDPSDLELRDLLGISPDAASDWDGAQRAAARRVLAAGLRAGGARSQRAATGAPLGLDERVAELVADDDAARAADGTGAPGVVRLAIDARGIAAIAPHPAPRAADALDAARPHAGEPSPEPRSANAASAESPAGPATELWLAERWDTGQRWSVLPGRGTALLAAIADAAGHPGGPVVVVPAPRLAAIAAYLRPDGDAATPRLAVNPVALAAIEPVAGEAATDLDHRAAAAAPTAERPGQPPPLAGPGTIASTGGNPYSFYGSVAECASAQRTRCETCLPAATCRPITNIADGNAECTMLGAEAGRGYFLLCINLSLAISSVDRCTGGAAPTCVRDPNAADSLASLDNNAGFLDDPACGGALDGCLAQIFGAPDGSFPGLDGGTGPGEPPRSTTVNCGNSCDSNKNTSCNASPSCDCSGPSCNNSLSCDSACSSSNDQSGCGGNCNACTSSGCGGSSGGGGCSDSGGGSSSSGGC
ncbi:MAG TPA: hypothetical protein VK601_17270, partial [Kofleriaceae bacterium]|nr:hypothetical protein [Kofleriaceae bacterium]